jgi:hypothetical protein
MRRAWNWTWTLPLVLLVGCGETSEKRFPSMADVEAQSMVTRGWIPEALPRSGTDVRIRWNIDTNMTRGTMRVEQADLASLRSNVRVLGDDVVRPLWARGRMIPSWWPKELNPPSSSSVLRGLGWEMFTLPNARATYIAVHASEGRLCFWSEGAG